MRNLWKSRYVNWFFLVEPLLFSFSGLHIRSFQRGNDLPYLQAFHIGATTVMFSASAVNFTSLIIVGFPSEFVILKYQ